MYMYTFAFPISNFSYFPFFLCHYFYIASLLTPNGKSVTVKLKHIAYATVQVSIAMDSRGSLAANKKPNDICDETTNTV